MIDVYISKGFLGDVIASCWENNQPVIVAQGSKSYVLYCLDYKDETGNKRYNIKKDLTI